MAKERLEGEQARLATAELEGQTIAGQFRIVRQLGAGGMGWVFLAEQIGMDRLVVVKVMRPHLSGDPSSTARFRREAKAVARLNHPNIVQVYVAGTLERGQLYMAMEYVEGRTLASEIQADGRLDPSRAVAIAAQVAQALIHAHEAGLVHRDLKPDNIMLTSWLGNADHVKVLDFGIAKLADPDTMGLTQPGEIFGTPAYMAPEQVRGDPVDHRVDIYALGAVVYEALTGVLPFEATTPFEMLGKVLREPVPRPTERIAGLELDPTLEGLVLRCLHKEVGERYQSAAAVLEALERLDVAAPMGPYSSGPVPAIAATGPAPQTPPASFWTADEYADTVENERPVPKPRKRATRWLALIAGLVLIAAGVVLWVWPGLDRLSSWTAGASGSAGDLAALPAPDGLQRAAPGLGDGSAAPREAIARSEQSPTPDNPAPPPTAPSRPDGAGPADVTGSTPAPFATREGPLGVPLPESARQESTTAGWVYYYVPEPVDAVMNFYRNRYDSPDFNLSVWHIGGSPTLTIMDGRADAEFGTIQVRPHLMYGEMTSIGITSPDAVAHPLSARPIPTPPEPDASQPLVATAGPYGAVVPESAIRVASVGGSAIYDIYAPWSAVRAFYESRYPNLVVSADDETLSVIDPRFVIAGTAPYPGFRACRIAINGR